MVRRLLLAALAAIGLIALVPAMASAHVVVDGDGATQGGFAKLTFSVPNESDTADTTKVEVKLPTRHTVRVRLGAAGARLDRRDDEDRSSPSPSPRTAPRSPRRSARSRGAAARSPPASSRSSRSRPARCPRWTSCRSRRSRPTATARRSAWIEETPASGEEPEHPAPTLQLAPASEDGEHASDADTTRRRTPPRWPRRPTSSPSTPKGPARTTSTRPAPRPRSASSSAPSACWPAAAPCSSPPASAAPDRVPVPGRGPARRVPLVTSPPLARPGPSDPGPSAAARPGAPAARARSDQ